MNLDDYVNVTVRIKPPPSRKSFKSSLKIISTNPAVLLATDKQQTFHFDNIFEKNSTQEDIYNEVVKPLVSKVKDGYNCTIFAYGQTGTGKTYTMGTNSTEKSPGIIPRALEDFFLNDDGEFDVHLSFMEIYNEKVYDLLKNNNEVPLPIKGFRVEGLSKQKVFNIYEAKHFLEMGGKNRHTGETKQNLFSSRSHAIFSIEFTLDQGNKQTCGKLNLVDLAGSESVKKTGTQGNSFQEGININKGLLCIGQVMTALSNNLPHIPYRQSIITTILQESLNRNNYISLIACVKCGTEDSNETLQALEFAQRVKKMRNKPEVREVLMKYKSENPTLFEKNGVSSTPIKRAATTPLRINHFKKPRGLSTLNSHAEISGTSINNSKSTVSMSSACNSEMGINFSPIMRKYMGELQNTLMDKLETVIHNTLKRPTRRSTRLSSAREKENTPKYSWNTIQPQLSKLIQKEVMLLTSKTSKATSSPIDHDELDQAKKILDIGNVRCPAMWSYVMAATKGDSRRLRSPESVFTVQPSAYGPQPGPLCRNTSKCTSKSQSLNSNYKNQLIHPFFHRTSDETSSRHASENTLAEVAIQKTNMHYSNESEEESQSSSQRRLFSAFRGRLRRVACSLQAAVRFRSFSKKEPDPVDWFVDKSHQKSNADNAEKCHEPTRCWGHTIIVDPSSTYHYNWLMLVSLAVLYNVVFVLGRAVFWELNNSVPVLWWTLDYACDAIYILDILVRAHEGYLEQGLLVTDPRKLRAHYLQTKHWKTDLLALIPTDLAYFRWHPFECDVQVPCPVIVRVNRLFKLPRLWEWFERTETDTNYPNVFRICKVVLAILVLIHWNACLYFAISYAIGFGTDNWVYNLDGPKNSTLARQYIYSFYWSTLTLTTIGETPVPENEAEYLFVVADFLAGVLIFATIVGNIGSMISNMNLARVDFQNRMDGVKQYMAFRKVGRELEARVIRWFAYTWTESGALDEERVLSALPDKLKAEIAIRVHLETLQKVRIFQDCEPGLLEALVLKLKLQVFSPGDYICRKGDVGKEMYIVKRGRLQVVADDGHSVLATLSAGSVFGEVSVLDIAGNRTGNRRTANVRSLGYSDLFCLAKDDLLVALADYPDARATLIERGCQLLRKDGLLDEEMFRKARETQDSMADSLKKLEATVEMLQTRLARLLAEFTSSQAKLKQRITRVELRPQYHGESKQDKLEVPFSGRRRLRSFETQRKNLSEIQHQRFQTM